MKPQEITPGENEIMESRLWNYIDAMGSEAEQNATNKLITENNEWRARYHELLEVHSLMKLAELEQPSMRFTQNVMEEITRLNIAPATKNYINQKIIWGIAAFFITVIVSFIIYGVAQIDWNAASDVNTSIGIDFSRIDYSRIFDNSYMNVFMMLNIVLGLMLLDKYLSNKKRGFAD
jgi:hypothetical protein